MLLHPQRKFPNVASEHHFPAARKLPGPHRFEDGRNPMADGSINHCLRFVLKESFGQRLVARLGVGANEHALDALRVLLVLVGLD